MIRRLAAAVGLACVAGWPRDVRVSFNLSARDLASPETILNIMMIVRESGVVPDRIDFEVTEAALMSDFDQSSKSLRMLKALGAGISLDDFGKGYSSLSHFSQVFHETFGCCPGLYPVRTPSQKTLLDVQ